MGLLWLTPFTYLQFQLSNDNFNFHSILKLKYVIKIEHDLIESNWNLSPSHCHIEYWVSFSFAYQIEINFNLSFTLIETVIQLWSATPTRLATCNMHWNWILSYDPSLASFNVICCTCSCCHCCCCLIANANAAMGQLTLTLYIAWLIAATSFASNTTNTTPPHTMNPLNPENERHFHSSECNRRNCNHTVTTRSKYPSCAICEFIWFNLRKLRGNFCGKITHKIELELVEQLQL